MYYIYIYVLNQTGTPGRAPIIISPRQKRDHRIGGTHRVWIRYASGTSRVCGGVRIE